MISIGEALGQVLGATRPLDGETVPIEGAAGRVLAEDVAAPSDVPGFANSQMDGFAVRAGDLANASPDAPAVLRVVGTAAAGHPLATTLGAGAAARIMTGAPVPTGADAVVPVEEVQVEGDRVRFASSCAVGRFVRPAGEDLRCGETVLLRGQVLRPADVGLLASMGRESVAVSRRPQVAIVGTGDELVPVGRPLGPGQIHDSNAYVLAAAVQELGGEVHRLGIVRDDRVSLRSALLAASASDFALSTGGVSVGDFDYVREIMDEIGLRRVFWRVAQKPGKPLVFAVHERCRYFGLPGNPVSAMVCFLLYVAPAVRAAQGCTAVHAPTISVTAGAAIATARDLTELVRCSLRWQGDEVIATPTGSQSSGVLRSLSLADALLVSPPGHGGFAPGERGRAMVIRSDIERRTEHPFS